MKRFAVIIAICAMAFSLVFVAGCSSGDSSQSSASSDAATQDGADGSAETGVDSLGVAYPVAEPPIPCTKEATVKNVTVKVPEAWTTEIGVGGYLKIVYESTINGSVGIDDTMLNAESTQDDFVEFINSTMAQSSMYFGLSFGENPVIEQKGDLAYTIIPFSADSSDENGEAQAYWGYSYCGFDKELILADFSCEENDPEVLATFRWILENIQIDES